MNGSRLGELAHQAPRSRIYSENSFQRSMSRSAALSTRLWGIHRRIKFRGHPWSPVPPAVLLEVGFHFSGRETLLTLLTSGTGKPHVLDQGSDAGTPLVTASLGDTQIIPRHTLLLCQLELSTTTRTRGKLLRGYSELRVSAAFSAAWMRPF
jgi:hypothetical protein